MKRFLIVVILGLTIGSCKKDDGGTQTPPSTTGPDFSFPAATKFAATLYAPTLTVANGAAFDIRFVLYNVTDAFGAAAEIIYSNNNVRIDSSAVGPAFSPPASVLSLRGPASPNTYAYGVTYIAGSNRTTTGSGVIVKLYCHAIAAGAATFTIDPAKFEVKKADGTPIANFGNMLIENVVVTIN
ncbi:MAG: hypothetical protein HW412_1849 [Bacteroidetes bacterium]|nr:hypothetical protein [Bacteroidota bacterium]